MSANASYTTLVSPAKSVLFLTYAASTATNEFAAAYSAADGATVTSLADDKHGDIATLADATYDVVASAPALPFSDKFLAHVLRVLKPAGTLYIGADNGIDSDAQRKTAVLTGFTDVRVDATTSALVCGKPDWSAGASAPLSFLKNKKPAAAAATTATTTPPAGDVWSLAASDMVDDGIELEDEDALLEDETDAVVVAPTSATDDCGVSGKKTRKACKDCTCGRKEELDAAEAAGKAAGKIPIASACGSCGLGDAFRCSGCPYLGQPAFAQGDVVRLAL